MPPKSLGSYSPKNTHENVLKESEDFNIEAKSLYEELIKEQDKIRAGVVLSYGTFEEKTSSGRIVEIHVTWTPNTIEDKTQMNNSKLRFFTIDKESKQLAATRDMWFDEGRIDKSKKEYISVHGSISTRFRNLGIASSTDKILVKVLQNMANNLSEKELYIRWEVMNLNQDKISKIEKIIREQPQDATLEEKNILQEKLKEAELEQERWQSLYGYEGKFGIEEGGGDDGNKKFKPQPNAPIVLPLKLSEEENNFIIKKFQDYLEKK